MNYIAFDLGTKCGVATLCNGVRGEELWNFSKSGRFSPSAFSEFAELVENLIVDLRQQNRNVTVFIEKPHAGQYFHAVKILFGLMGVLEMVCHRFKVPYIYYSPATIKRMWTGSGRATKAEMLKQTQKNGFDVKDHNVADAIALLHYGIQQETK